MGTTLYVVRRSPDRIPSSIFQSNDLDMDIVFVEQEASMAPSAVKGFVMVSEGVTVGGSHPMMTFDDLIEKIFSSDHIIIV
jgi:hypothetical protein